MSLRDAALAFNYVEVAIWPVMGVILGVYAFTRRGLARRDSLVAAVALVAFGASDWFEANTENEWWQPWWLLLWKAACVVTLATVLVVSWRRERAARRRPAAESAG